MWCSQPSLAAEMLTPRSGPPGWASGLPISSGRADVESDLSLGRGAALRDAAHIAVLRRQRHDGTVGLLDMTDSTPDAIASVAPVILSIAISSLADDAVHLRWKPLLGRHQATVLCDLRGHVRQPPRLAQPYEPHAALRDHRGRIPCRHGIENPPVPTAVQKTSIGSVVDPASATCAVFIQHGSAS